MRGRGGGGRKDNEWYRTLIPIGDQLNYWCIGYIEKIGGGHHRHYEFFIWMLRRLNYRAVWATLLTASYMGPSISAIATNRPRVRSSSYESHVTPFRSVRRKTIRYKMRRFYSGFTRLNIYLLPPRDGNFKYNFFSFKNSIFYNCEFSNYRSLRFPMIACIDQADHNERNKQSIS